MNLARDAVRQPVTVAVGVLLVVLAGSIALQQVPIQLTPDVEDTVVAVTTRWEGASPLEIEQEIVDKQEEQLQGIANLRNMTSTSQQGLATVKLEFNVGTPKEDALREVSDKLREVPSYPENVDEPVIEASDPENRDYIAWFIFETTAPGLDIRHLKDFADDRVKPRLERVPGVSEVNVLGGREREVHVLFDPEGLARRGITVRQMVDAIRRTNRNISAGTVSEAKSDVRLRLVNQYESVAEVERTVLAHTEGGPVRLSDVARVEESYKEPVTIVRSRGKPVLAINAQKEVGANVMEVMAGLQRVLKSLNEPGEVLDSEARRLGLDGNLTITQVYDQTVYIHDALDLVENNIWLGGGLALGVLLLFLGTIRGAGIIGLAIPISVVGAVVAMLALGRTINVISLAGMAFAVGMVVDNAIVVLENVFRHLEMGKRAARAAVDGAKEVGGAVLASTLTTVVVFVPILLVQEEAGQLFRDISLAIVAAVSLSLLVSLTVIPSFAARVLREIPGGVTGKGTGPLSRLLAPLVAIPGAVAELVHRLSGSVATRVAVVAGLTAASVAGTVWLMPPSDYLPQGNRNLVFGLLIPPPGYNLDQVQDLSRRIESTVEPYWEAGRGKSAEEARAAMASLPQVPTFDFATMGPGKPVTPPPIENYFLVSLEGIMFHGAISAVPERIADVKPLFQHATRNEVAPGVLSFAFQVPLFRLGGTTGSAVKVNFAGDDLGAVTRSAEAAYGELTRRYGHFAVQPNPSNFNVPGPELRVEPDLLRLGEVAMSPEDLGQAVQALGDGAIIGDYRIGGKTIDLKVVTADHGRSGVLARMPDTPVATPSGRVVPLGSLADFRRVNAASQINRESRQRAVTLQFTPQGGMPLEQAVTEIDSLLAGMRTEGRIPPEVETSYTGSASKLQAVRSAMLGDGSLGGILTSSLVLALALVYLLMCVLFQSFLHPLVILFSVPLATVGGFAGLRIVHDWSRGDPYMPVQNLDVLTMLGFVILIGVVVNNAILIVHQALNFMRGTTEETEGLSEPMPAREAIREAVRTRVRPIFMSTLTSVGGMLPLVLMPGSGSELYRGLGSVVIGGLVVSTVFTLLLVPMLMSLVMEIREKLGFRESAGGGDEAATGTARVPAAAAAAVLLLGLGALPLQGCAGTADRTDAGYEKALRGIAARQLRAMEGDDRDRAPSPAPEVRLADAVRERREELERMGGPASYEGAAPSLDADLYGGEQEVVPLGLRDAVAAAARGNLGVRLLRLEEAASAEGVTLEEAAFDAVFFADLDFERVDEPAQVPVLNNIQLGSAERGSDSLSLQSGVRQRFGGGGSLTAAGRMERRRDRTPGIDFVPEPAWWSGLTLAGRQPLLRGYGSLVNRAAVELARFDNLRAGYLLEEELLLVVAATEQAYWDLEEAWRRVLVQQELLARGEETARVLEERRIFDTAPAQHSDALATVEFRRADLVRARRALRAASDRLKLLMNHPDFPPASEALLRPVEGFGEETEVPPLRAALERACGERPALLQAVVDIEDAALREDVARNGVLPQFDLLGGVSVTGLDDRAGSAAGDLADDDFLGYSAGVSLEVPLGNRAARSDLRRAELRADASYLRYERTLREVAEEVKGSLRDMESSRDLVAAALAFRLSQTENLRALLEEEERRSSLTPEFLNLKFQRQERLAQAQMQEVAARADYHRARAAYRRAVGTALGAARVRIEGPGLDR